MRQLVAIASLVLFACHGPAPSSMTDANATSAVSPAAPKVGPSALAPKDRSAIRERIDRLKARAAHPQKAAAPDARVLACTRNATDKDSLMQCLRSFSFESAPDAGPSVHKLGAERSPVPTPAWNVPDIYINHASGNNNNTCTDSSHPCQTGSEVLGRWGTSQTAITTAVTVHSLDTWPQNADPFVWTPIVLNGGVPVIKGVLVQETTGTLASVIPKNRPARQALQANIPSGAAVQGMEIVNTTRGGNSAWVDEIVSGSTVILTQPLPHGADDSWFGISSEPDNWANGDSIIAYLPTTINLGQLSNILGNENSNGLVPAMVDIWVQQTQGLGPNVPDSSVDFVLLDGVNCFQCRIDREVSHAFGASFATTTANNYINSWMGPGQVFQADTAYGGSVGAWDISTHTYFYGYSGVDLDTRLHNNVYWQGTGQNFIGLVNFASDAPAVSIFGESFLTTEGQLFGSQPVMWFSSSSTELRSRDGGRLYYTGPAASAFPSSPTLWIGDGTGTFGTTMDRTVTGGPLYTRALSVAQLDTTIASGGLGGIGLDPSLSGGFIDVTKDTITTTPSTYLNSTAPVTISANAPGAGQVSLGFTPSTCPPGQYIGGNPLACSTPSSSSFACSSLNPCTGGQLPETGIRPGVSHNTLLATTNGGSVSWEGITPGGDINLSAPITGASIPFMVIGWNTIPLSGAAPSVGNVYVYTGSNWVPGSPIGGAAFNTTTGSHVIPATGVVTSLGSLPVTVPAGGGNITVYIVFLISNPDNFTIGAGHLADDIVVGVGFNSSTSFDNAVADSVIVRDSSGGNNTGKATVVAPDYFATQPAGSYTIYALAESNTQTFTVLAEIWALVTK